MTTIVRKDIHEELIRQIREVGESLIKNAESIAGTENFVSGVDIFVDLNVDVDAPEISVTRKFIPERFFDRQED